MNREEKKKRFLDALQGDSRGSENIHCKKTATTYINLHNNCLLVFANEDFNKKVITNRSINEEQHNKPPPFTGTTI